jgi:hypothetical protein
MVLEVFWPDVATISEACIPTNILQCNVRGDSLLQATSSSSSVPAFSASTATSSFLSVGELTTISPDLFTSYVAFWSSDSSPLEVLN